MSASPGRSTYGVALEAISGVTLIGVGAGLTVAWSVETTPQQWLLLCLALLSILAGVYLAVSAGRGSRTLPPAGPPTLTQEVLAALNPACLAGLILLSKKSDDSIWLLSLGVGLALLSLGLLAATVVKRVHAKAQPAGVYLAVSAGRGSRTLPPAGPPTLTQEVLAAFNPAWLAGLILLSKKSDDSIWLLSLGVGLALLSLGLLAATVVKRVRAKAQPT